MDRVVAGAVGVPAVDDPRLLRVQGQTARGQARVERRLEPLGFLPGAAVADDVIRVALERDGREDPTHPHVESIMQEQVREDGADHSTHNLAKLPFDLSVTVPRERLRPKYRDGFWGAPLALCRPFGEGQPAGGGADGPEGAAPRGAGEP